MLQVEEYRRQANMCVRCSFCKIIDLNWVQSLRFSRQCPIDTRYAFNLKQTLFILLAVTQPIGSRS